jgi:hypothetical protein
MPGCVRIFPCAREVEIALILFLYWFCPVLGSRAQGPRGPLLGGGDASCRGHALGWRVRGLGVCWARWLQARGRSRHAGGGGCISRSGAAVRGLRQFRLDLDKKPLKNGPFRHDRFQRPGAVGQQSPQQPSLHCSQNAYYTNSLRRKPPFQGLFCTTTLSSPATILRTVVAFRGRWAHCWSAWKTA